MFHDILEDSWSYQEIVQKGLDQGLQKGFDQGLKKGLDQGIGQGELITSRQFLARIIEKHFPPLLYLAQQKAAQLTTIDKLNKVIDKLLEVQTLEQARQVLEENDL
jgi:flagellar biosynthesis/type III secretory pathway protein FliH